MVMDLLFESRIKINTLLCIIYYQLVIINSNYLLDHQFFLQAIYHHHNEFILGVSPATIGPIQPQLTSPAFLYPNKIPPHLQKLQVRQVQLNRSHPAGLVALVDRARLLLQESPPPVVFLGCLRQGNRLAKRYGRIGVTIKRLTESCNEVIKEIVLKEFQAGVFWVWAISQGTLVQVL